MLKHNLNDRVVSEDKHELGGRKRGSEREEPLARGAHSARLTRELVHDSAAIVYDFAHARQTILQSGLDAHDVAGRHVGRGRLDEEVEQLRAKRLDPLGVAALETRRLWHEVLARDLFVVVESRQCRLRAAVLCSTRGRCLHCVNSWRECDILLKRLTRCKFS